MTVTYRPGGPSDLLATYDVFKQSLADLSATLTARMPQLRVVDARQPRVGRADEPITAKPADRRTDRWVAPIAAFAGMTLLFGLD